MESPIRIILVSLWAKGAKKLVRVEEDCEMGGTGVRCRRRSSTV